ncbi:MAG: hypothetical protein R3E53_17940 [Myxococcota bacterium]
MRNRWTLVLALLALLGLASTAGCEIGRGEDGTTERPNGPTATGRTSDPAAVLSPTSVDELARMTDPVARADRFLDLLLSLEPAQYPELARQLQHRSDEWAEFGGAPLHLALGAAGADGGVRDRARLVSEHA